MRTGDQLDSVPGWCRDDLASDGHNRGSQKCENLVGNVSSLELQHRRHLFSQQ